MEKLLHFWHYGEITHFHCKALATHSVMEQNSHTSNTDWQSGRVYHLSELVYTIFTSFREEEEEEVEEEEEKMKEEEDNNV